MSRHDSADLKKHWNRPQAAEKQCKALCAQGVNFFRHQHSRWFSSNGKHDVMVPGQAGVKTRASQLRFEKHVAMTRTMYTALPGKRSKTMIVPPSRVAQMWPEIRRSLVEAWHLCSSKSEL